MSSINFQPPLTSLQKFQWQTNDYFAYYRRGLDAGRRLRDAQGQWQLANSQPNLHLAPDPRLVTPAPSNWEDIYQLQTVSGGPWANRTLAQPYSAAITLAATSSTGPDPMKGQAVEVADVQSQVNKTGVPFTIKRVLGKGGMGLAMLCESNSPSLAPRARRQFCLKYDMTPASSNPGQWHSQIICVFFFFTYA